MASAQNQHKVLSEGEVLKIMKQNVSSAQETIHLPVTSVRLLLHHFKWDLLALTDSFFTNEELTLRKANCVENKAKSSVTDFSSSICSKCLVDLDKTIIKHGPCGHAFCYSCCLEYLRQSIVAERKSLRIECPVPTCSFLLDDDFVTNACSSDQIVLETYWSLLVKSYIEKKKTLTKCPGHECKNTVFLADPSCCNVQCSCGEEFCFECASTSHYSFPCMLIKDWEEVTLGSCTRHNYMLRMTKKCPKCNMEMMMNEESDGMCCSWCDLVVCSRCQKPLTEHMHCKEEVNCEQQEIMHKKEKNYRQQI
jgi:ariadne-1